MNKPRKNELETMREILESASQGYIDPENPDLIGALQKMGYQKLPFTKKDIERLFMPGLVWQELSKKEAELRVIKIREFLFAKDPKRVTSEIQSLVERDEKNHFGRFWRPKNTKKRS